jgi:hypothetical protein
MPATFYNQKAILAASLLRCQQLIGFFAVIYLRAYRKYVIVVLVWSLD